MCGLFGSFGVTLSESSIEAGHSAIRNRGPDDFYIQRNTDSEHPYTAAAARLAFRDVANGRQPIRYKDRYIASLNGEIYNYDELVRDSTLDLSSCINTKCDTEIIAPLFDLLGTDLVRVLKGMFAVSVWDIQDSSGYLITDYLAQKSIYYIAFGHKLLYASDMNTLLALLDSQFSSGDLQVSWMLEHEEVYLDLLRYKSILGGDTLVKQIKRLPPSSILTYKYERPGHVSITTQRYDASSDDVTRSKSLATRNSVQLEDAVDSLDRLLRESIMKRVDTAVHQSIYLSGGLDSSLIASLLRDMHPDMRVYSFTLCYKGIDSSGKDVDRQLASYLANRYSFEHNEITIDPTQLYDDLPSILRSFGEPFSAVPSMWYVAREIARYSKYSLSGDGADELFGSYFTHRRAATLVDSSDPFSILNEYSDSFIGELSNGDAFASRSLELIHNYDSHFGPIEGEGGLSRQLLFESTFLFPYGVLTYIDRLSMAHSVEPRSPFLDKDIWDYVRNLPDHLKINQSTTKYMLKRLAERYLPESIVHRKKEGFVFPLSPYLLKYKKIIISRIVSATQRIKILRDIGVSLEYVDSLYHNVEQDSTISFKSAQLLHSLYVISLSTELS